MIILKESNSSTFNKINKTLVEMGKKYYPEIPLKQIFSLFEEVGITPVQEDMTPWDGILVGKEGQTIIDLMEDGKLLKRALNISWYKMQSGRYEIVAYC
jgi:hypothetical protein